MSEVAQFGNPYAEHNRRISEQAAEIARLRSELAAEREVSDAARSDDQLRDGTDAAHPAYWRGQRDGVDGAAHAVLAILDGHALAGQSASPILQLTRERAAALRLSDADRAALATASSELRERRMNWAATYSRVALEQQDNTVTDSYRRTIAEVTAAIEVIDRLRGVK